MMRTRLLPVAVVLLAVGCASSAKTTATKTTSATTSATVAASTTVKAPPVTAAPTTKAPSTTKAPATTTTKAPPAVVFQQAASGTATTDTFGVHDEWQLAWTYDCSASGSTGNFIVSIAQPPGKEGINVLANDQGVNQLGANGSGVEHYHYGGTIYLKVISECKWTVKVTS